MAFQIEVTGLRELARAAKKVDPQLGKELRKVFLTVTNTLEQRSRASMSGGRPRDARAARGVRGKATQKAASIRINPGPGWTLASVFGQKRRSGWYARGRYRDSRGRQFDDWVGVSWNPGDGGQMPYYVGPVANDMVDEAADLIGDGLVDVARRAGFN